MIGDGNSTISDRFSPSDQFEGDQLAVTENSMGMQIYHPKKIQEYYLKCKGYESILADTMTSRPTSSDKITFDSHTTGSIFYMYRSEKTKSCDFPITPQTLKVFYGDHFGADKFSFSHAHNFMQMYFPGYRRWFFAFGGRIILK